MYHAIKEEQVVLTVTVSEEGLSKSRSKSSWNTERVTAFIFSYFEPTRIQTDIYVEVLTQTDILVV